MAQRQSEISTLKRPSREGSHGLPVKPLRELKPFSFTSFGSSVDVNVLRHVDRAAKLSERVTVSMENGRHLAFSQAALRRTFEDPIEAILVIFGRRASFCFV